MADDTRRDVLDSKFWLAKDARGRSSTVGELRAVHGVVVLSVPSGEYVCGSDLRHKTRRQRRPRRGKEPAGAVTPISAPFA